MKLLRHLFPRLTAAVLAIAASLHAQTIAVDPATYAPNWPEGQRNIPFVFNKDTGALVVEGGAGGGGGGGSITFSNPQSVRFSNGSAWIDTLPITVATLPLPTGAATAANQISGGPQTGSGVVTATTQRVVLASDGPGVATLTTIAANSLKLPTTTTETHVSVTTAATGTNYTAFASQACLLLDIVNTSGTDIEVTRGGTGVAIRVPNNSARMFGAITNASQLSVRRADTSNTQVAVTAVAITP
jgi:hypothetical protein